MKKHQPAGSWNLYEMISYSAIGGSHSVEISLLEIRSILGETFFEEGVIKLMFEGGYSKTAYKLDTSG